MILLARLLQSVQPASREQNRDAHSEEGSNGNQKNHKEKQKGISKVSVVARIPV